MIEYVEQSCMSDISFMVVYTIKIHVLYVVMINIENLDIL